MKLELFFIRSLFVLATLASAGAMAGMLHGHSIPAQQFAHTHAVATHVG